MGAGQNSKHTKFKSIINPANSILTFCIQSYFIIIIIICLLELASVFYSSDCHFWGTGKEGEIQAPVLEIGNIIIKRKYLKTNTLSIPEVSQSSDSICLSPAIPGSLVNLLLKIYIIVVSSCDFIT